MYIDQDPHPEFVVRGTAEWRRVTLWVVLSPPLVQRIALSINLY